MSLLKEKLNKGEFVVTLEMGPPKGVNVKPYLDRLEPLKGKITAVNVTDNQSAVMRLGSLGMCHLLKEKGFEPVYQLVTRDRNRLALQSDLLSAYVLGVENVLCITGDSPEWGDHPQAKPVYDLDSIQLLEVARRLNEGKDMAGNPLEGQPNFFLGAAVNPFAQPLEPQIIKMEKKIEAGARFFQTQPVYDVKRFAYFMEKIGHLNVSVLAGIVLLKSAKMAKYMNDNVPEIFIPDEVIEEIASASREERPKKSLDIALRTIKGIKPLCQGIHIIPLGWEKFVFPLLEMVDSS